MVRQEGQWVSPEAPSQSSPGLVYVEEQVAQEVTHLHPPGNMDADLYPEPRPWP